MTAAILQHHLEYRVRQTERRIKRAQIRLDRRIVVGIDDGDRLPRPITRYISKADLVEAIGGANFRRREALWTRRLKRGSIRQRMST